MSKKRLISLILAICILFLSTGVQAQPALPTPSPTVTLDLNGANPDNIPSETLIGESFTFKVTFQNTGTLPGFNPFIDLYLPLSGADGDAGGLRCDGIEFLSASLQGIALPTLVSYQAGPACSNAPTTSTTHPLTNQALTYPGHILAVLPLPFGSYFPEQPVLSVDVTVLVSDYADPGFPLSIVASGGFQYGDSPLGNSPPIIAPVVQDTTTPVVMKLTKHYLGPEDETATGANFPQRFHVELDIAQGQTLDQVVIGDRLPANLAYKGLFDTSPTYISLQEPPLNVASSPANLQVDFGPLTGFPGSGEAWIEYDIFVPQKDANGQAILASNRCTVLSSDDVWAEGFWTPLDPRDVPQNVVSDANTSDHILNDRCLALQKSAINLTRGGLPVEIAPNQQADILEYTLTFQLSDFFNYRNLILTDELSDGQLFLSTPAPNLFVTDRNGISQGIFPLSNLTVQNVNCSIPGQRSKVTFNISQALITLNQAHNNGILSGGATTTPTGSGAVGTIVFQAQILDKYLCTQPVPDRSLVKHDLLDNRAVLSARLLNANYQPVGSPTTNNTQLKFRLSAGLLNKTIYAINGNPNHPELANPVPRLAPGDTVTYRITYQDFPSGEYKTLIVQDFLPLPVMDVANPDGDLTPGPAWQFDPPALVSSIPAVGHIAYGPLDPQGRVHRQTIPDYCAGLGGSWSDPVTNRLCMDFDTITRINNLPQRLDVLFTVQVTSQPYTDGLNLANQAAECEQTSKGETFCQMATGRILLTEPSLRIHKFITHPGFLPSTGCPRFTPTVNSTNLPPPLWSKTRLADGGDLVTFIIVVENLGSGLQGAFDVRLEDSFPDYTLIPKGGLNLCVTDGNGAMLPSTITSSSNGFFIELSDPGATTTPPGALDPYQATDGRNLAIITFDLLVDPLVVVGSCYPNTTYLRNYAAEEGGPDFVAAGFGGPFESSASYCPLMSLNKQFVASSEASTPETPLEYPPVTIGEIVRYRLSVKIPEGTAPNAVLEEILPPGMVFPASFASDGTTKFALISHTGLTSTNSDLNACQLTGFFPATPTCALSAQAFTAIVTQGICTGTTSTPCLIFNLGTLTNSDNDNNHEGIVIDINLLVANTSDNRYDGNFQKINYYLFYIDGELIGESYHQFVRIAEPRLTMKKEVIDLPSGLPLTAKFQLTIHNPSDSVAFDLLIEDELPPGYQNLQFISFESEGGSSYTQSVVGNKLVVSDTHLNPLNKVTVTYQAEVVGGDCEENRNTAVLTWSSLPGAQGTIPNPTGSQTPGLPGAPDGERNGDLATGAVNTYRAEASANVCYLRVAASDLHSLALRRDGTVYAWGSNGVTCGPNYTTGCGVLGDGTDTVGNFPPRQVVGPGNVGVLDRVVDIAAGGSLELDDFSFALRDDGTVWSWGVNHNYCMLGANLAADHSSTPVQVVKASGGALEQIIAIAAGEDFGLALDRDGHVWSWGGNDYGQVGDGTQVMKCAAVPVIDPNDSSGLLSNVKAIGAGLYSGMAIKQDGSLWQWGWMMFPNPTAFPLQITGLSNIVQVTGGMWYFYALDANGEVWQYYYIAPNWIYKSIDATNMGDGKAVSGGGSLWGEDFGLVLNTVGEVWGWGSNLYGELGDGNAPNPSVVPVQAIDNGMDVILRLNPRSYTHSLAINNLGQVWAWGNNSHKQAIGSGGGSIPAPALVPLPY